MLNLQLETVGGSTEEIIEALKEVIDLIKDGNFEADDTIYATKFFLEEDGEEI